MAVQLRFEDRVDWLDQLLSAGQADVYDAKQRFFPTLLIWASSLGSTRLREFVANDPHNPALLIAAARYETAEGRPDVASAALRQIHQNHPDNLHALAALLEATFEMHLLDEFIALNKTAPAFDPAEPWLLTQMRRSGHPPAALGRRRVPLPCCTLPRSCQPSLPHGTGRQPCGAGQVRRTPGHSEKIAGSRTHPRAALGSSSQ